MVLKTLAKSVREYKRPSVLTPVFMTLEVALECFIPLVMARLLDSLYGDNMRPVIKFGVILLAMAMVSLVCGTAAGRCLRNVTAPGRLPPI